MTQFHITCWAPDGQCSNPKAVVDVIEEVAKVQRRTGSKPILVHCRYEACVCIYIVTCCFPNSSDTVTRSGMFCALATVIDRCKTEGIVDVFQVVKALRTSKPGAVPTMVCCFNLTFVIGIIINPEAVFILQGRITKQRIYIADLSSNVKSFGVDHYILY